MMKRMVVISVLILVVATRILAQSTDTWALLKEKFPDEPMVYVDRSETLNLTVKNDSLYAYADIFEDLLHLKEQSNLYGDQRVYGSYFRQISDLKAKTRVWEKNKYKDFPVEDFKKKFDDDNSIFYDDSYYYSFSYPAVGMRSRTQLEYRNVIKDVRFISGYVFSSYFPQARSRYTIRASQDVEIIYKVFNDPNGEIKFKKTSKGNVVTYEWLSEMLPSARTEDHSLALRYYTPHVVVYVKSYTTSTGKKTVLSNLDDLYHWYYSFLKDLDIESSDKLVNIVNDLKTPGDTELDVVRKIFYWVQDNIQYIAFEDGMRGLIPHNGSYVCDKRFGDCKDMANLIVEMLRIAGVKAYHTWIGTRDLPYKYTEVPTPLVDNHMIATYIGADGKYYFLDGTSDYTPFGLPSSMIQGKEALIAFDADHYKVVQVPIVEMNKNASRDSVVIKLTDTEVSGQGKFILEGFQKVFSSYRLDRSKNEKIEEYLAGIMEKGSNKFFLDNYEIANLHDREKPTVIDYSFRVGDYFKRIGSDIYFNLNLNKENYGQVIDLSTRKTPYESEFRYVKEDSYTLLIPEGYKVDYLPPDAEDDAGIFSFSITYKVEPGSVTLTKKINSDYLVLNQDQFERWNTFIRRLSDAYKESIILSKI